MFDSNKIYNVTAEELRAIQERAKIREAMKKEFQMKVTNPYQGVGGYIVSDLHAFVLRWVCQITEDHRRSGSSV